MKIVDDSCNHVFEVERKGLIGHSLGMDFTHEGTIYQIRGLNRDDGITGHRSVSKPCQYIWRVKKSVRLKQRYAGRSIDSHTSAVHVVKKI